MASYNRSFVDLYAQYYQSRYAIWHLCTRMIKLDHIVFILRLICSEVAQYAASSAQAIDGVSKSGVSLYVDENATSHTFCIYVQPHTQVESAWSLMARVAQRALYTKVNKEQVVPILQELCNSERAYFQCAETRQRDKLFTCSMLYLQYRLQSYYEHIHVYRTFVTSSEYMNSFIDVYRYNTYCRELSSNAINNVKAKHRSKSCEIGYSGRMSDCVSLRCESSYSSISIVISERVPSVMCELVQMLERPGKSDASEGGSDMSQGGSDETSQINQTLRRLSDDPAARATSTALAVQEQSILVNYFQPPDSPLKDKSSNSSFVVISDSSSELKKYLIYALK